MVVLDASALLALLHGEPGSERVAAALETAAMSTVNWSEVLQKSLARSADIEGMEQELAGAGVRFVPFTTAQAERAALLWSQTRRHGLSLADRACLALALEQDSPVLTADRAWSRLGLGAEIELIR
jgi:PIN domain nuclease of toxin-antitoxin system